MKCEHCKATIPDMARHCVFCGEFQSQEKKKVTCLCCGQNLRLIDFLDDILDVGYKKPMGYVPLSKIGSKPLLKQLIAWARQNELEVKKFRYQRRFIVYHAIKVFMALTKESHWCLGDHFYVYKKPALQKLINENREILEQAEVPLDADLFVDHIIYNYVEDQDAFVVVGLAFADKRFRDDPRFQAMQDFARNRSITETPDDEEITNEVENYN